MAEAAAASLAPGAWQGAPGWDGAVYVLDLADFSSLTERAINENARTGIEAVSRKVTGFFTCLSSQFTDYGIRYGGFAGDALIAAQVPGRDGLGEAEFTALAAQCAASAGTDLRFRVGLAQGAYREVASRPGSAAPSFLTGPAVTAAFRNLKGSRVHTAASIAAPAETDSTLLASASVIQRWTIVARLLGPDACDLAGSEQLMRAAVMCEEICEAFGGVLENITQDDKGLLAIIAPGRSGSGSQADCDAILFELRRALGTLDGGGQALSAYGTVFQCQPYFSGVRRLVSFGAPLNLAAKTLHAGAEPPRQLPESHPPRPQHLATFVGRKRELSDLEQAAAESRSHRHTACLIGPAGIGKSAILRHFLERSREASLQIELTPVDRHIPFGCALQLAALCQMDHGVLHTPEGLIRLQQTLPAQLIIENWHWCDEESRRIVKSLWQANAPGLLIVASREAHDLPGDQGQNRTQIDIDALSPEVAAELVGSYAPASGGKNLEPALLELSGGNPFWLIQAALHTGQNDAENAAPTRAGGLEALLSARARGLSPAARTFWRLHCAWRSYLPQALAEDILSALGLLPTSKDIEQVMSLGWLETSPEGEAAGNRPVHDILSDWGVSDLPASFEKTLNGLIARRLMRLKAPEARIARHWQMADEPLRASVYFERAAQRACDLGAYTSCIENLDQARGLAEGHIDPGSRRSAHHLSLTATAQWGDGRLRRAAHTLKRFEQTVRALPRSKRLDADRLRAAFVRSELGQFSGNAGLIVSGLFEGARLSLQSTHSHNARARRASFFYYLLGLARLPVHPAFDRLIAETSARGDFRSEVSLRLSSATLHMSCCRWPQAAQELRRAHDAVSQTDDTQLLGTTLTLTALCHLFQGNGPASLQYFQQLEHLSGLQGHQIFSVWSAYGSGESHYYAGDLAAAGAGVELATQRRLGLGDHQSSCIIEGLAAQVALHHGDDETAERRARNALRFSARLPPSNFSTLEGIAAPAEIGAALIRKLGPSDARSELVTNGLKALRTYAVPFALARPRLAFVEGRCLEAAARRRPAARKYARAVELATRLGMQFETQLASRALAQLETSLHV